jgi:hypothetical protein
VAAGEARDVMASVLAWCETIDPILGALVANGCGLVLVAARTCHRLGDRQGPRSSPPPSDVRPTVMNFRVSRRVCAALLVGMLGAAPAAAQRSVTLVAEPIAVGVEVLGRIGATTRVGLTATGGPSETVNLGEALSRDYRTVVNGYVTIGLRVAPKVEALVSPIGVAVVTGDDFAAACPSAQAAFAVAAGRLRFGSGLRVVRIAGGNGTGDYWWQWIPVRIGIPLGR